MAKVVVKLAISDGAAGILEAAIAWVAGAAGVVKGDVDLEGGVAFLGDWEHVIGEFPEADGTRNEAEDIDGNHFDSIAL